MRLVKDSAAVIQAWECSEPDVKGFLKTGLAAEHYRVGALLNRRWTWTGVVSRCGAKPAPSHQLRLSMVPCR
jgi:hypothetical protein